MHHDNDDDFWKYQYDQHPPIEGNYPNSGIAIALLISLVAVLSLIYYLV